MNVSIITGEGNNVCSYNATKVVAIRNSDYVFESVEARTATDLVLEYKNPINFTVFGGLHYINTVIGEDQIQDTYHPFEYVTSWYVEYDIIDEALRNKLFMCIYGQDYHTVASRINGFSSKQIFKKTITSVEFLNTGVAVIYLLDEQDKECSVWCSDSSGIKVKAVTPPSGYHAQLEFKDTYYTATLTKEHK